MLVITFEVHSEKRGKREVIERIVETMSWRLKRIAQAIGAEASFLKGEFFANDYIGRHLLLTLTVEDHPKYGEQNRVKAFRPYIGPAPSSAPVAEHHPDEGVPF